MAGTPVVASDIPAHREVLASCSNVRLIPLGAPPAVLAERDGRCGARASAAWSGRCRPGTTSPSRRWPSTSAASRSAARGSPPDACHGGAGGRHRRGHSAQTATADGAGGAARSRAPYAGGAGRHVLLARGRTAARHGRRRSSARSICSGSGSCSSSFRRPTGCSASRHRAVSGIALVAATGAFLFIPKVLRDPQRPDLLRRARPLAAERDPQQRPAGSSTPNSIVHFAQFFPGLDSVDVAFAASRASRRSRPATAHARDRARRSRCSACSASASACSARRASAALAALVYALNTSFMFFDSQYSYESLAFLFFIWSVVCAVEAVAAIRPAPARVGWTAAALVAGSGVRRHAPPDVLLPGRGARLHDLRSASARRARRRSRARRQALVTIGCITRAVAAGACIWAPWSHPTSSATSRPADAPRRRAGDGPRAALGQRILAQLFAQEHDAGLRAKRGLPRARSSRSRSP